LCRLWFAVAVCFYLDKNTGQVDQLVISNKSSREKHGILVEKDAMVWMIFDKKQR
jgi:hypothetical protein